MRTIEWTEDMSVGLAQLDDDHKGLIAILNRLYDAAQGGGPEDGAAATRALQALADYTDRHFGREEAVLEAVGYGDLAGHRAAHADFVEELNELAAAFDARRDPALAADLAAFLQRWLTHHILVEDMAYRPLVQGNATAREACRRFAGRPLARAERAQV